MTYRRFSQALVLAALALWPALVSAQPVMNPTKIDFTVAADHAAKSADGVTNVVDRYVFRITEVGAAAPMSEVDLGKPTPDAAGLIIATPTVLLGLPVGKSFTAEVVAVGPGGQRASAVSNPFGRPTPPPAPLAPGRPTLRP